MGRYPLSYVVMSIFKVINTLTLLSILDRLLKVRNKEDIKAHCRSAILEPFKYRIKERIITNKTDNSKPFWLHFNVRGDGTEWIDEGLPTPNYFYRNNSINGLSKCYCIAYLLDGYFKTTKNQAFLNDVIARMILTLPVSERLLYAPSEEHKQINTIYRLKDFQALKSLTKQYVPKLKAHMKNNDNTFWEIKLFIEHKIRDNGGEGSFVDFITVFDHAMHFYEWKDISTCKAKIRNIWSWYESRDWQYHILKKPSKTEEEILMTRQERAKANAVKREKEAKAKVINAVTGMFAEQTYKKKNGSWNITAIAKDIHMTRNTVSKHLKIWESNKGGLFEEVDE